MAKQIIIGLCGHARSGKDSFCQLAIPYLSDKGHRSKRVALADELKKDLNTFLIQKVGISPFTQREEEKNLIRPLLVAYGTNLMRSIDEDWWLKKLDKNLEALFTFGAIPIVTDIRYENELKWLKDRYNLHTVYIQRKGIKAANSEEAHNNVILKKQCDQSLWWPTYGDEQLELGRPKVIKVINKILKQAHGHVRRIK